MDKPTSSSSKPETSPTTTDDESMTTSTASDFFESWTLVTEKQKDKNETLKTDIENRIETLTKDDDEMETSKSIAEEEKNNEPTPDHDTSYTTSATDEFSDEVSIISESDSGEVITPHPYLQEHLHKLNLKFTTGQGLDLPTLLQQQQLEEQKLQLEREDQQSTPPNIPLLLQRPTSNTGGSSSSTQVRQRKRRSPSVDIAQKSLKPQSAPCTAIQRSYFIRRVYSIFFYTIVGLLILGFCGKLSYPEWPLGGGGVGGGNSRAVNELEQKVIDMELQNNLMRAEIDILAKQVNYLNTIKDKIPEQKKPERNQWNQRSEVYNKGKEQKHWQDKNKVENAECASDDLICTERKETEKNVKEQQTSSQTLQDKYINPLDTKETATPINDEKSEPILKDTEKQMKPQKEDPQFNRQDKHYKQTEYHHKGYKNDENLFKERFNKHNSRERRNSKEMNGENVKRNENPDEITKQNTRNSKETTGDNFKRKDSSEKNFKRERYNSKEANKDNFRRKDDSGENFKRNGKNGLKGQRNDKDDVNFNKQNKHHHDNVHDDDSHERSNDSEEYSHFKDNSKERKFKKRRNKPSSKENFGKDAAGEWHENWMNQREKARLEQEQRYQREKNWYLNRRDSREQWRTDEMNRR